MPKISFDQALDAVEELSADQQADLLKIIARRLSDRHREQVVVDIEASRAEHKAGLSKTGSVQDIMREIEACDVD